jgi:hypothetical protein
MNPLQMLHKGDFNDMEQQWQPDGSVILKLHKREGKKYHILRVKNLYQDNEEEVNVDTGEPIN